MKKKPKKQLKFGLIGQNISYSFSEKYFTEKFEMGHYDNCEYANYDLNNIQNLSELIHQIIMFRTAFAGTGTSATSSKTAAR
jgi:shikimate dehydrogenase